MTTRLLPERLPSGPLEGNGGKADPHLHGSERGNGTSAADALRIEEWDVREAARALREEWAVFRRDAGPVAPFLRPDYLALWADAFDMRDACRVVVALREGGLAGYAPFMVARDPFGPVAVPTLKFIGNNVGMPGDVLYADVPAVPPGASAVHGLLDRAASWGVEKWDLGYVMPSSDVASIARSVLGRSSGTPVDAKVYEGLALPGSREQFLEGLSANARGNFRRRLHRLERLGAVGVGTATRPDAVRRTVRALVENHRRWWDGTERADWFGFGDGKVERYLEDAAALLASEGMFIAFTLELDGKPISWNVGAYDSGRYYEQYISFDREYVQHSPGTLLGILAAGSLIDLGAHRMDLGPGLNERKHALGGVATSYERVRGYRGWRRAIASVLGSLRRAWTR